MIDEVVLINKKQERTFEVAHALRLMKFEQALGKNEWLLKKGQGFVYCTEKKEFVKEKSNGVSRSSKNNKES